MSAPGRLVLVDGSALVYRAYFAIPASFRTKAGLPTNATYGFASMFRKLFAGKRPTHGAVVFDAGGSKARTAEYPEYKSHRPEMADDMRVQLPYIDQVVAVHRFPALRVPGVEADDIIGTLARLGKEAGLEVHVLSGDKDFAQLVTEGVRLVDPVRDINYDPVLVKKKWGVRPEQIVDLLALVGDASDGIPGVPGIGQKGAEGLLAEYKDLADILAHKDALKPRLKNALTEHLASAELSRRLATIDQHLPLTTTLDDLLLPDLDPGPVDALYRSLEFYSLLAKKERSADEAPVETVSTAEGLAAFLSQKAGPIAVAPLLVGPRRHRAELLGLGLGVEGSPPIWVPLNEGTRAPLLALLADPARAKTLHDVKRLVVALHGSGAVLEGADFDTRLASFLVDPTKILPHELDQVAREHLGRAIPTEKTALEKRGADASLSSLSEDERARLYGTEADAIARLRPLLHHKLVEAELLEQLVGRDMILTRVLAEMEIAGVLVDAADLIRLGQELDRRLAELETQIHGIAGHPFNIASTKQLGDVLFEELKLPVQKRNKTGYSTDSEVLERLAKKHEIAALILEHRRLGKLISTYTSVLAEAVDPADGRIHATFQETVGATGRLITTDPDLQRTPVKTAEGRRIRRAFIAPPGTKLISADWSQIELRILAHVAEDPRLISAFAEKRDVHRETAGELFHVAPEAVTAEQRGVGKTINFATIYGQGATALGQILGIPKKEAEAYIDRYFQTYAGVRSWLDRTIALAQSTGYATTLLKRRRFIPELSSKNVMDQQAGQRIAANTPIQGSAADIAKLAMLSISRSLRQNQLKTRMLLQIHDELVFEVPEAEVGQVVDLVRDAMERAYPLRVPLVVEVGVGNSWGEAH
ncbi:MAG: DNA polymerase I [Myxococcota bacterium]